MALTDSSVVSTDSSTASALSRIDSDSDHGLRLHRCIAHEDCDIRNFENGPRLEEIGDPIQFYFATLEKSLYPEQPDELQSTSGDEVIPDYAQEPSSMPLILTTPPQPISERCFKVMIRASWHSCENGRVNKTHPLNTFVDNIVITPDYSLQTFIGRLRTLILDHQLPKKIRDNEQLLTNILAEKRVQKKRLMFPVKNVLETVMATEETWTEFLGQVKGMKEPEVVVKYWIKKEDKGKRAR